MDAAVSAWPNRVDLASRVAIISVAVSAARLRGGGGTTWPGELRLLLRDFGRMAEPMQQR